MPARASPWSIARIRIRETLCESARAIAVARGLERLVELLGIAAAGLGDLGAPAAAAADDRGRLADHVGGDERRARPRCGLKLATRATLPSSARAEDDRGVAGALLDPVGELEQLAAGRPCAARRR